jgi:AbrB family looped-hinge helix DNA binding protein
MQSSKDIQKPSETISRTVSDKGQTVIPKRCREYLQLEKGDRVEWTIDKDGKVVVRSKKKRNIMDLKGIVKPKENIEDMERVIIESKKEYWAKKQDNVGD